MKWLLALLPGGLVLLGLLLVVRHWRERRQRFVSRRWAHHTQRHASAVEIRDGLKVLVTVTRPEPQPLQEWLRAIDRLARM